MSPAEQLRLVGGSDAYQLAASTGGGGGSSRGGGSGGDAAGGGDAKLNDKYAMALSHFLDFHSNETVDVERLSGPILKSSIKSVYWLFLIQYAALALLGVVLNVIIVVYIMYHRLYKDVTHAFIINLALCHFVQCALVLPVSLMVMLIQNWIFGQFLCFFLPMLQPKRNEFKKKSKKKYGQRGGKHVPRNEPVESPVQMGVKMGASDAPLPVMPELVPISKPVTEKGVVDLPNKTLLPQYQPNGAASKGSRHGILEDFKENDLRDVPNTQQPAFLDQLRSKWNHTLKDTKEIVVRENAEALLLPFSSKNQPSSRSDPVAQHLNIKKIQDEDSPIDLSSKKRFPQENPAMSNLEPHKNQVDVLEACLSRKDKPKGKPKRKSDASRLVSLDHQYVKENPRADIRKTVWRRNNLCDHSLIEVKNPKKFRNAKEEKAAAQRWQDIEAICMRLRDIDVPDNVGILKGPVTFEDVFDVLGIKEEQQEPQPQADHPPAAPTSGTGDQPFLSNDNMALEEDLGPDSFDSIFDYLGLGEQDPSQEVPLPLDLSPLVPLPVEPYPKEPYSMDPYPGIASSVVSLPEDPTPVVPLPVAFSVVPPAVVGTPESPLPALPPRDVPLPVVPPSVAPFPMVKYPLTGKEDAMTDWTDSEEETDQRKNNNFHTVVVVTQGEEDKYVDVEHVDTEPSEEESLTEKENTDEEDESFMDSDWTIGNEEESDTE
ncbi:uncharacterized protein LOC108035795 isoform X2 [Drosophila biarmipes]|uniref:uncharacterized protein LOC108035795 isoform X2 n=1 Tax=Drosophila biarmipes TaxID=125945 RepID=UPI0021CCAB75|nr:uncharacterized protein LOC108035795 isoform X2 [Drosophila biarmipes]